MNEWHLDRLPDEVRREAESAAQSAGIPLHRWLGQLIRETSAAEGISPRREPRSPRSNVEELSVQRRPMRDGSEPLPPQREPAPRVDLAQADQEPAPHRADPLSRPREASRRGAAPQAEREPIRQSIEATSDRRESDLDDHQDFSQEGEAEPTRGAFDPSPARHYAARNPVEPALKKEQDWRREEAPPHGREWVRRSIETAPAQRADAPLHSVSQSPARQPEPPRLRAQPEPIQEDIERWRGEPEPVRRKVEATPVQPAPARVYRDEASPSREPARRVEGAPIHRETSPVQREIARSYQDNTAPDEASLRNAVEPLPTRHEPSRSYDRSHEEAPPRQREQLRSYEANTPPREPRRIADIPSRQNANIPSRQNIVASSPATLHDDEANFVPSKTAARPNGFAPEVMRQAPETAAPAVSAPSSPTPRSNGHFTASPENGLAATAASAAPLRPVGDESRVTPAAQNQPIRAQERQTALTQLAARLKRNELSPIGEARFYLKLMTEHMAGIADITVATGRTREQVARTLRLLSLPDPLRDLIDRGTLSRDQAFALLDAPHPEVTASVLPSAESRTAT